MSENTTGHTDDPRNTFFDAALWHGPLEPAQAALSAHPEIAGEDIYTAAILGDDSRVRAFLAEDPSLATAKGGPKGWDALTYLCFSKYLRLDSSRSEAFVRAATALLDAGASANTGFYAPDHRPEPTIESALYGAAGVAHHPELTKLLLDHGADPNDDEVPYHAPETMDNRALQILVESGKLTPNSISMMLARKFNWHDDDAVAWILDHGADPNFLGGWGQRPLHTALRCGNSRRCFEMLLDHGADPHLADREGRSALALTARMARADLLELFEKRGFTVVLEGDDAFFAACTRADAATARKLVQNNPGMVERIQSENPGLLIEFAGSGNTGAPKLLLDLGFDANAARSEPQWMRGETALHVCTARGRTECVKLLIERGASLEAKTNRGHTPLAIAVLCMEQQSEWTPNDETLPIARMLIEAGANIEDAHLTLAAAACLGRADDVQRLARQASRRDLQVALAAAAYNGLTEAIPGLIALGADPNARNEGLNPEAMALHSAVCSGSLETVRRLVQLGALPDVVDGSYRATPRTWAEYFVRENRGVAKQDAAIVEYLRSLEAAGKA